MSVDSSEIQISLPGDFLTLLNQWESEINLTHRIQIILAVGLFLEKKVTLARAAELARKSLGEFVEILSERGIAWKEYTDEDKRLDDIAINKSSDRRMNCVKHRTEKV